MFLTAKKSVNAKLVGNTLVAVFRASDPSLIWKFDLERNHSFTLALQGEEGDLELGVTSPKGEFYSVARFASREDAEEAFAAVQKVLMKKRWCRMKGWLAWAIGIAILILLIMFIGRIIGGHSSVGSSAASQNNLPQGVPLPADQILEPPPTP